MVKKPQESKVKKAAKITSQSSKEKKKWTVGKTKDIVKRKVAIDEELYKKIESDTAKMNVITKYSLADKYTLNIGVAQKLIEHFGMNKVFRLVSSSSKIKVYAKQQVAAVEVGG